MTAEMTAGGVPAPAVDETPAPPVAGDEEPRVDEQEERRRRRKMALLLLLLGLLAMLVTIAIWYLIFRQPINPLPPIPVSQVPSYSTSFYDVARPIGVAVSPDGSRMYVSESQGERIVRILDGNGTIVGGMVPPVSTGADHAPVYLAIDPLTSEVYVSDRPTGAIYVYDQDGAYLRTFTPATARPGWQPLGLAFDGEGNLYVTDLSGPFQKVVKFDRQAVAVATFGESLQMSFPNSVAVDAAGNVYVTDSNNGRLLVFDPEGELAAQVGRGSGEGNLGLPRGLSIDNQNRVFVGDTTGQGVLVYRTVEPDAQRLDYLGVFGGEGVADGAFRFPNAVATDRQGRVYVADTGNDRIQLWSY
jgi:DNA-binding beta-propeller fold protein YncE